MAGHWTEKLFRMKMGYMELTGEVNSISYTHCAISFKSKFNID